MTKDKTSKIKFKFGKAEKKLLIILCYHISATVISMSAFAEYLRRSKSFSQRLQEYLVCEQPGHDPSDPCDRESIESLSTIIMLSFTSVLHGIQPLVYLVFVVNTAELRGKVLSFYRKIIKSEDKGSA